MTKSTVQIPSRRVWPRPLPRRSNRGRSRTPAERSTGSSTSSWAAMPTVEPMPSSASWPGVNALDSASSPTGPKTSR